jgi:hypothetical protein
MSVSSPCEICTRADVEHSCDRCGRLVCDRHFDDSVGFCTECADSATDGREHRPSGEEMPDGVDTFRF